MNDTVDIVIDGRAVDAPAGATVLEACLDAGVYIPHLCAYPGLGSAGDCELCLVRIVMNGGAELQRACRLFVEEGMVVQTGGDQVRSIRTDSMKEILGRHPHVCLVCPQRDGCSRDECMYGDAPETRCCDEFGRCEIAKVAAYVGALDAAPAYRHRFLGTVVDHNIRMDRDQCVGCGRCIVACDTLQEAGAALRLVSTADGSVAVPKAEDLRASGCTFCANCILVCPTRAFAAEGRRGARWLAKRRERSTLGDPVLPPGDRLEFERWQVVKVPRVEGVFRLYGPEGNVLQISGVMDLKAGLSEALEGPLAEEACTFVFEEEPLYTQRESELMAQYLQEHGSMPEGNDIAGDLFDDGLS